MASDKDNPSRPERRFRSQDWFDNQGHIDMTALYLERFMNYGMTPWQAFYRQTVGRLETGACLEQAVPFQRVSKTLPRHNH